MTNLFFLLRRAVIVHVQVLDSLALALAAGHLGRNLLVFGVVEDRGTALGSGLVLVAHCCGCFDGFVGIGDGMWMRVAKDGVVKVDSKHSSDVCAQAVAAVREDRERLSLPDPELPASSNLGIKD